MRMTLHRFHDARRASDHTTRRESLKVAQPSRGECCPDLAALLQGAQRVRARSHRDLHQERAIRRTCCEFHRRLKMACVQCIRALARASCRPQTMQGNRRQHSETSRAPARVRPHNRAMESREHRGFRVHRDRGRAALRGASSRTCERAVCTASEVDAHNLPAYCRTHFLRSTAEATRWSETRCLARAARWCGESSFQAHVFEIAESAVDRAFVDSLRARHDPIVHDQRARDGACAFVLRRGRKTTRRLVRVVSVSGDCSIVLSRATQCGSETAARI